MKILLTLSLFVAFNLGATTYYIDHGAGNDSLGGTTTGTAWKSIPGTRDTGNTADLVSSYGGGVVSTINKVPAGTIFKIKSGTTWDSTDGGYISITSSWYDDASAASPIIFQVDTTWGSGQVVYDASGITVPIAMILIQRNGIYWDGVVSNGILVENSTGDGIQYKEKAGSNASLLDCNTQNIQFFNNGTSGFDNTSGSGLAQLSFRRATGVYVYNCVFDGDNNWANGLKLGESGMGVTNAFVTTCSAFTLQGSTSGNDSGIGFKAFNSQVIFTNCISTNNLKGFDVGEQTGSGSNIFYTITSSTISSNIWGIASSDRSGPRTGTHTNLFYNNIISSNYYNGLWNYGGPYTTILIHNLFLGNGAGNNFNAYQVRMGNDSSEREVVNGYIYNNIFFKPSGRGQFNVHYFNQDSESDGFSLYSDYNSWVSTASENFAYWGSSEVTSDNQIFTYGANGPGNASGNWYVWYSYSITQPTNGAFGHFHADGNSYATSGSNPTLPLFDSSYHLTGGYRGANLSTNSWYLAVMGIDKDGVSRSGWDLGPYEFIDLTARRLSGNAKLTGNATLR